ncbi:hypothetical protein FGIG_01546 [Fasciola gigantica]|uniref:Uncharacterized protein n=1 Tax=Fasciola gigantica TaxID=46835 RepID=A0A504YJG8_FASGI|nr:hypothetical protein FGIG_01546 [Fasciola gigantica]
MYRTIWIFCLVLLSSLAPGSLEAPVTKDTATPNSRQNKQPGSSTNIQTVIQSTNLFKDVSQVPGSTTRARARSSMRDLKPFEWLYKHLSDYLMCSYGEHTDCDKKLAKSMALEESITKLENLKKRLNEKPPMDETAKTPVDTIHSNAQIMSDFGYDITDKGYARTMDPRPMDDFRIFGPNAPRGPFDKDGRLPLPSKMGEPFMRHTGPMKGPWPGLIKDERDFRNPPEIPRGPIGPVYENGPAEGDRFNPRNGPMNQGMPPYPFMSMPLFVP